METAKEDACNCGARLIKYRILTFYMLKFSEETQTGIYNLYMYHSPQSVDTDGWNSPSCKTRTFLFNIVSIMGADALATQGARASATVILTMLIRNNSVLARLELIIMLKCIVFRYVIL